MTLIVGKGLPGDLLSRPQPNFDAARKTGVGPELFCVLVSAYMKRWPLPVALGGMASTWGSLGKPGLS